MKKNILIFIGIVLVIIAAVFAVNLIVEDKNVSADFSEAKNLSEFEKTDFIPTLEHKIDTQKNSVYCVTLLYAWEEVRKQINQPLIISPNDNDLLLLNNSKSFINALNSNEYSVNVKIEGSLIKTKAEFSKSLPFGLELNSYDNYLAFKGEKVASFGVNGHNDEYELRVVKIVYYKNDNNFIIKLLPKNRHHEIILFKTDKVFNSMAEMNEEIIKLSEIGEKERKNENQEWKYNIEVGDEIVIPKFNFNIETNYATLEQKEFKTNKQEYRIDEAWQRTAFLLDESGARIESESDFSVVTLSAQVEAEIPKKMIFDNDFLLLLKRTDAQSPYFGLWVTNTELMIKK